ncbi:MAG: hypothetical protein GY768_15320 [Planctomycetaceae bacterium]|nr:hypothetical protein [Planctomycetaceae bacterium]
MYALFTSPPRGASKLDATELESRTLYSASPLGFDWLDQLHFGDLADDYENPITPDADPVFNSALDSMHGRETLSLLALDGTELAHHQLSTSQTPISPAVDRVEIDAMEGSTHLISQINTRSLHANLDSLPDTIDEHGLSLSTICSKTLAAAAAGYLIWTSGSNYLISGLRAVTPEWPQVDPLPILEFAEADGELQDSDRQILDLVQLFDRTN